MCKPVPLLRRVLPLVSFAVLAAAAYDGLDLLLALE
jgi:hypothetical protein